MGTVMRARISSDRNSISSEAFSFDGNIQHILVPNHPLLNFDQAITLSTWFKINAIPDRESFLLSHGSWQQRWKLSLTPTRQLRWTVNSLNGIKDLDSATELLPGTYHQVTATYDGSYMALYLDGELETVAPFTGKIRTTTLPMLFGQMWPDDAQYNFAGCWTKFESTTMHFLPIK
ncbi:MAG: LamG domain-containing protein [Haliscomenobacter sp.]|nr:LamG domain-containing protein [Haliscomenobacter sp.]MBK9489636.1 LamG domain-containing protein [Haliscomenobacter sp.]